MYCSVVVSFLEDAPQRIVINVYDVDEKPRFVATSTVPMPFLGVVPVEAPLGYTAFKITAKDEDGDGDGDVEYKLINTERKKKLTKFPPILP